MKKLVSLSLAGIMAIGLFAGCANNNQPADLGESTQKPAAATTAPAAATTAPAAATTEAATEEGAQYDFARITWYYNEGGIQCPPDNYFSQRVKEDLNIEYVPINPVGTDYEQQLLTLIASGDSPDIIMSWKELTQQFLKDNLVIPVDQYLNEQYLPNLIRISYVWEEALAPLVFPDGHQYGIPSVRNNFVPDQLNWIRQDWLDAVGMSVPTTLDELSDVLIAFANHGSPNGDNVTYYPNMSNELWGLAMFFSSYAADHKWYMGEDGLPELGTATERVKDALKYIKNLLDNKALNADLMTTQYDQIGEKIKAGVVGYHYGWSGYDHLDAMQKVYPDAKWTAIMPLDGPVYDKGYFGNERTLTYNNEYYNISTACKDVEAALRLMDYMCVDTATSTDPDSMTYEGSYWYLFGERGVHWDVYMAPGDPDGAFVNGAEYPDDPEKTAFSTPFKPQNEVDKWAGWAMRRFLSIYDTRWMGTSPRDKELNDWKKTIPTGNDIPSDNPYRPLQTIAALASEDDYAKYSTFNSTYMTSDSSAKFAEVLGYPAVLGYGDIDALYDAWIDELNANGYQEIRQIMGAHYTLNPPVK